ncbi:MAG: hypothetical protein HZC42_15480 [Candidatus Eisenbacteria bacterium]|nr:hypothetical protein [Candidatus Eisenbacteria bacterium]
MSSDVGPWVAWYGERTTVQLPNSPRDVPALARILPIHAIVLTNQWALSLDEQRAWRAIFEGTASLPGWARADTVATGRLRAVVLWPAKALPR